MARRASFGARPRVQQSYTGTLIALAREMQNARDQNIMNAWKEGSVFEGSKVTDEKVLAYWKGRDDNLDKNDPMYDSIQNQIMQLRYGIEQSKMDLAHVQGKVSDREYAQFFLKWAAKAPRNSEWWRTLQKDAAQLMESAKAKSKADAEKAKVESFNAFMKDQNKDIAVGTALTDAMTALSKETGLSITNNGDDILALLTTDYAKNPGKYHALRDALAVGAPEFSGTFSNGFVASAIDNSMTGFDKIATRANRDGYAAQYSAATQSQADMTSWATNMHVWPVAKAYDAAYSQFARVWNDDNASYMDKQAAAERFSAAAMTLSKLPGIDTGTATMIEADATRAIGGDAGDSPSFGAASLGGVGITPEMQTTIAMTTQAQMAMDQNPGQFFYASVDKNGNFDATGKGALGIVSASALPADVELVAQPGLGGSARMVAVQPHAIMVKDPNNPDAAPTTIGSVLSYQVGGKTVTLYGYKDSNGQKQWSNTPFTAQGVSGSKDKDENLVLTLPSATNPTAKAAEIDAKYGTDISTKIGSFVAGGKITTQAIQRDAKGKEIARIDVTFDGKSFDVKQTDFGYDAKGVKTEGASVTLPIGLSTPQDLQIAATAPSRWSGGTIKGVTYSSPAATSMAVSADMMSSAQVATLAKDPAFQMAFMVKSMSAFGTNDPADPRIVSAWSDATAAARGPDVNNATGFDVRPIVSAQDKSGLTYPGQKADPTSTSLDISYHGQTLRLPNVPAYLNNQFGKDALAGSIERADGFSTQVSPFAALAAQQVPTGPGSVNKGVPSAITPTTPAVSTPPKVTTVTAPTVSTTPPPASTGGVNNYTGFTTAPPPPPKTGPR